MNISLSEILVILIVALVVIKPEQLPDVAFKLGQWAKQLRKGMTKLRHELDSATNQLSDEVALRSLPEKIEINNEARKS